MHVCMLLTRILQAGTLHFTPKNPENVSYDSGWWSCQECNGYVNGDGSPADLPNAQAVEVMELMTDDAGCVYLLPHIIIIGYPGRCVAKFEEITLDYGNGYWYGKYVEELQCASWRFHRNMKN